MMVIIVNDHVGFSNYWNRGWRDRKRVFWMLKLNFMILGCKWQWIKAYLSANG